VVKKTQQLGCSNGFSKFILFTILDKRRRIYTNLNF
jgi:hypothetical protein